MEAIRMSCIIVLCVWSAVNGQVIVKKTPVNFVYRPFEFAYQSSDGLGTSQHREEVGDESGTVKGTYGFLDPLGMYRSVEYTADDRGFRATIKTNEPGTANQNSADTVWIVEPPPAYERITLSGTGGSPRKVSLPAQTSTANFTPIASPSAFQVKPDFIQYPLLARPAVLPSYSSLISSLFPGNIVPRQANSFI